MSKNFWFLKNKENQNDPIYKMAVGAENYVFSDPNTCLMKLRQFGECIAKELALLNNRNQLINKKFSTILYELGKKFPPQPILPKDIYDDFKSIKNRGNDAIHEFLGDESNALLLLKKARKIAIWYQKHYKTPLMRAFGAFEAPELPDKNLKCFEDEIKQLKKNLSDSKEKTKKYKEETIITMNLAEEMEEHLITLGKKIDNIGSLENHLEETRELVSKNEKFSNSDEDEIVDLKYYYVGLHHGIKKRKKLTKNEIEQILNIQKKYKNSDPAEGMTDELFNNYSKDIFDSAGLDWQQFFVKIDIGYVLKGLRIDESTRDLFYDEDRSAEAFYQFMKGCADGLTGLG
jgi:hypothetical protein